MRTYIWHGIKVHLSKGDFRKFQQFRYSPFPVYSREFLASWKRKRKRPRLKREEREACHRFLERLKREGDAFATQRVFVEKIDECIGCGLFARKKIRKGTIIGVYSGRAIPSREENRSRYLFYFSRMKDWDIDARTTRNYTAFMNHAKARTKACNVKPVEFYAEEPKIVFIATKDIERGSQLCYDYGDDYWGSLEDPDDFKRVSAKKGF